MDVKDYRVAALRALEAECGGKQVLLAGRINKSASQISQWYSGVRTISEETARDIERLARKPPGWMDVPRDVKEPFTPYAVSPHSASGVGHEMSHPGQTIEPQEVSWEEIVSGAKLSSLFVLPLPDDANAPEYPAGTSIIWSTTKTPAINSLVLVRDSHGTHHVRRYHQGRKPGSWHATPSNPAYATFDAAEDALSVVAVAAYRALP